jgi:hypothetical protein
VGYKEAKNYSSRNAPIITNDEVVPKEEESSDPTY